MGLLFVKVYFERDERGNDDNDDDAATRNISRASGQEWRTGSGGEFFYAGLLALASLYERRGTL